MYYEKLRIIIMSDEPCNNESVVFTEDFDAPSTDWCKLTQSVDSDDIVLGMELPSGFPIDCTLDRDW